jgi:hypothetical protein
MEPLAGQIWVVEHSRKGQFHLRIENVEDDWIGGTIVEGVASYLNEEDRGSGDPITCRRSLLTFKEQVLDPRT